MEYVSICNFMEGSISFEELRKMPLRQYFFLRRAVDIEKIKARKLFIQDLSFAFNNPKEIIKSLDKDLNSLFHLKRKNKKKNKVNWGKDSDWEERLNKYKK